MDLFGPNTMECVATVVFAIAVAHTFSTKIFARMARVQPQHAGLWHLLGEVEVVFGFWAFTLMAILYITIDSTTVINYLDGLNYTEPMFVLAIMVIASTRPVLSAVQSSVEGVARLMPVPKEQAFYFLCLSLVPLFGSFITEPGAMTLAALLLRDVYFKSNLTERMKYATLAVLFVNISIGGTLTNFAAPPVLMVAGKWNWDTLFMLTQFGWRAAIAVLINAAGITWLFRNDLLVKARIKEDVKNAPPLVVSAIHLLFMAGVVFFSHHPVIFLGIFLLFLGFTEAYKRHQHEKLFLREALLVSFFLAGLVTLGGLQKWWLEQALADVSPTLIYFISTGLTAITDNAALTYLGSLVSGVSAEFKYALVAGAVTGGGLTVIANAPNPAGLSILKSSFRDQAVSPVRLFLFALPPTCVAMLAFLIR